MTQMAVCKDFPCKQQITHDCDDRTAAESVVHGSAVQSISFVYQVLMHITPSLRLEINHTFLWIHKL